MKAGATYRPFGCAVLLALLALCVPVNGQTGQDRSDEGGCFFVENLANSNMNDVLFRTTTGKEPLDRTVSEMLFAAARAFLLERSQFPAFRFLAPGSKGGDGFARESGVVQPGTQGLVALSLDLLKGREPEEMELRAFEVILGHEFAHIYQVRKGHVEPLRMAAGGGAKYVELHADFMAGWFMSQRSQTTFGVLERVTDTLFARGDNKVGTPGHHGTKAERFAAVLQGYLRAGSTNFADGAAAAGIEYLRAVMK
jgi:hypothetical protein